MNCNCSLLRKSLVEKYLVYRKLWDVSGLEFYFQIALQEYN